MEEDVALIPSLETGSVRFTRSREIVITERKKNEIRDTMKILPLLILSIMADPSIPANYCGRVDIAPQLGVNNYLTSPGFPGKTTEAGRCQWV